MGTAPPIVPGYDMLFVTDSIYSPPYIQIHPMCVFCSNKKHNPTIAIIKLISSCRLTECGTRSCCSCGLFTLSCSSASRTCKEHSCAVISALFPEKMTDETKLEAAQSLIFCQLPCSEHHVLSCCDWLLYLYITDTAHRNRTVKWGYPETLYADMGNLL